MRLGFLIYFCSFVFLVSYPAEAKGLVKVGDKIPHDLSLLDQNRKKRSFEDLAGKKGIVLVFVRSVNWCPYCQKQVLELNKNRTKFKNKDYNVVIVSYDSVLSMTDFLRNHKPAITMLSDPRSKSIRAFGILDQGPAIGTRSYGMSHPGIYIIDKKRKVRAKFFEQGYKNRPSVNAILSKITQLTPKPKRPYVPPMTMDKMGQDPIVPGQDVIDIPDKDLPSVLSMPDESDAGVSLSPTDYEEILLVDDETD